MNQSRCAIYARYSSEKQNSLTIGQQIRKCREYAERHDLTVSDEHIFADEAISGATDDRIGLHQISSARPSAVRSNLRDTRRFVEVRLRNLRKLLNAEPKIARPAISKHVQKITLAPEGRA